ncbi:MAG TPA: VOC family protein [Candidatus Solibacter sp.]|nr:VOC family protein [Candidatus Solibacter sp.]
MKNTVKPIPAGYHTATPYLVIKDAAKAIEFYKQAFGAQELFRMPKPDGTIMHGEIQIGDSRLMVADQSAMGGAHSPQSLNGTPVSIFLYFEDVDSVFKQAIAAGATETMPVQDMFWGDRYGRLTDPFGHQWHIATHKEDVSPAEMGKRAAAAMQHA